MSRFERFYSAPSKPWARFRVVGHRCFWPFGVFHASTRQTAESFASAWGGTVEAVSQ